ncbi:IucA/IucC family protein [Actinoplanes sp. NPDC049118]|uniref:IucA/IucC family protein n=1 Tax=Actinoplanes sp. NPDC049118 TaxID=3155769 RepID=UPI00340772CE
MPTPPTIPMPTGHTAGTGQTRDELRVLRPEWVESYEAELPAARAAVLARVLGALDREPLPGVTHREHRDGSLRVTLADGRVLTAPAVAAAPFAAAPRGLAAELGDGETFDDPAALLRALPLGPHTARLAAEVDNSVANLALAHADPPPPATRPVLRGAAGDPDGLGRLEQLVPGGHPTHPCCRTRGGMSVADVLAYGPEHRPVIRLRRLRVPADRWHGDGPPVLYAHPWQARRLLDRHPWLADDGETPPVRPLMSLRTVAPLGGGDHVKTAVDVQMTSAVRTVSPAAVHNGPRLSALLALLTTDLPLTVQRETAAGAVLVDGQPQRHLAHLRREAPRAGAAETVVPLAVLAAPSPRDGRPLLLEAVDDPYAWWHGLAHLLLPPLVAVLERGVALEAHGQNTLLVLDDGIPVRIVYRDLGGVRVSAARLARHGVQVPPLEGDLPSDDPEVLRTKLAAAVLGTVCAELIAVLSREGADPARLWDSVAAALSGTGTADAAHLLTAPLPVKATTAMRLADDPLDDVWTHVANPMAPA